MNAPETNDPIEKLLREQDTHVTDDGFTRRVIGQLPRRSRFVQRAILLGLAFVGAIAAFIWMPWRGLPHLSLENIFSNNFSVLSAWLPFVIVFVALGSAVWKGLQTED